MDGLQRIMESIAKCKNDCDCCLVGNQCEKLWDDIKIYHDKELDWDRIKKVEK